jgi:pimeloyl-ACP methyl ester carboxylesterase
MIKARRCAWWIGVLAAPLAVLIALLRTPDTDPAAMIAKYGGAQARFVDDGRGGRIHYRDAGPRGAPALVLIHGANSALQTWDGVAARLTTRYRVLSLDLYGHGLTGPNPKGDYSATALMDEVGKVLDEAGAQSAIWVGNSMGGWVAWRAALAKPDRLCGLVLVDASGAQTGEPVKPYLGARLMQTWLGQAILPHFSPRFLVRSSLEQTYGRPERLTDETVTRYWEFNRFPGNRQASVARANTDREPSKWREIGRIRVPTLVLWGALDRVTPPSHGNAFVKAIPGSSLITYPDAGHVPMEEIPGPVARDIEQWLGQLDTASCTNRNRQ